MAYTYDAAGITLLTADSNLPNKDWAYTYDEYSRLKCSKQATTCTSGATRVLLSTDAFNRTHQRTHSGTVTDHHYRGIGEDLAKTQVGTAATTYALTLGGSPLGQKVGTASPSFFLRDPHGDSVGLVSTAAANQGTTSYDPYGQVLSSSGTQPLFGYQSDITDVVTKQVDMGTRWYAPGQGRFSVRDVLWGDPLHPVSLNQWVYGAANPITMWDPTGMRNVVASQVGGGCGSEDCEAAYEGDSQVGGGESAGYDWSADYAAVVNAAQPEPAPARPSPAQVRAVKGGPSDWTAALGVAGKSADVVGSASLHLADASRAYRAVAWGRRGSLYHALKYGTAADGLDAFFLTRLGYSRYVRLLSPLAFGLDVAAGRAAGETWGGAVEDASWNAAGAWVGLKAGLAGCAPAGPWAAAGCGVFGVLAGPVAAQAIHDSDFAGRVEACTSAGNNDMLNMFGLGQPADPYVEMRCAGL